jgi:cytochrome c oxidase subunit 2
MKQRRLIAATIAMLGLAPGCGASPDSFNPVTRQGATINDLWLWTLFPSALVLLLVGGLLLYIIIRFRGRPGEPDPPQISGNRRLEIFWTATPALILAVFFILVVRTMRAVDAESPSALRVQVLGHQWWWEYQYPDLGVVTADELRLPAGEPATLELTGADVIHSFWVPQFGWKRDAIPGKSNLLPVQVDRPGVYDGACTEYCLTQHAWMRIRVVAEPREQFEAWICQQQQPARPSAGLAARGQQVFLTNTCVNCHAIAGTGASARIGPDLSHLGSRSILGSGVVENTPDNLSRWIKNVQDVKPGVLMPAYQTLPDDDLRALVEYLEGLK